jgi:hypothetical protein
MIHKRKREGRNGLVCKEQKIFIKNIKDVVNIGQKLISALYTH